MRRFLPLLLLALLMPIGLAAQSGHISVLTVSQGGAGDGGIADIYLEIRPGTGLTFMDSFPLTKVDTQISTRFAREYACALADVDCSSLDFFYVIRAGGSVLQGPSAGAAMTVLTYATLEDLELDQDAVMTGTINSGGLIGPVGGVPQKVVAARNEGFSRVLVPITQYNDSLGAEGVEVVPVLDVEEAIWYFTGEDVRSERAEVRAPDEYFQQMEEVMTSLCTRARQLRGNVDNVSENVETWLADADAAGAQNQYYTAASYCFSANLELRRQLLDGRSQASLLTIYHQLQDDIEAYDAQLPDDISTIADLEVYMIVRERLVDSYDALEELDYGNLSSDGVAYALERYNSAVTWGSFFGVLPSQPIDISDDRLRDSCYAKVSEAEERLNYLSYAADLPLQDTMRELENAREDQRQGEWALCMFKASKAKAEADSVLSALYGGSLNQSVANKLAKAEQVLGEQAARGNFPILAYSYYEYATQLDDPYSQNLYADYALELSRLDIFFADRSPRRLYDFTKILLLAAGMLIGFTVGVLLMELRHSGSRKQRGKRQKRGG